ncbi:MAG: hypothetical protein RQM92_12740 [Candidatus Syntrophopropionicum ammoniitolerans]
MISSLSKRYIIEGDDGTGKTTLISRLMEAAMARGYQVTAFHCALSPDHIDHLIIHDLDLAVINSIEPHVYRPSRRPCCRHHDLRGPVINEAYLAEKGCTGHVPPVYGAGHRLHRQS